MYDAATQSVRLKFAKPLNPARSYEIFVDNVKDVAGNVADEFDMFFQFAHTLKVANDYPGDFGDIQDGVATFSLEGKGILAFMGIRGADSVSYQLALYNTSPGRTVLNGRLTGSKYHSFLESPFTIVSHTKFISRLKNPPFDVQQILIE